MTTPSPCTWRHFEPEIIRRGVRWSLRSSLRHRDVEELLVERSLSVDHTTVFRWVQCDVPEIDTRSRPHQKCEQHAESGSYRPVEVCCQCERRKAHTGTATMGDVLCGTIPIGKPSIGGRTS